MENIGGADVQEVAYMAMLEEQLKNNPNNIDALLKKAVLSLDSFRRFDEAQEILKSIIDKFPENLEAYLWLSECLCFCIGDDHGAEQTIRKALTLDPNRADCHMVLAASLDGINSNCAEAEFHYRKATELEPSWILPRKYLANILFHKSRFNEALYELEIALPHIPEIELINENYDPIKEYHESFFTGKNDPAQKQMILDFIERIKITAAKNNNSTS